MILVSVANGSFNYHKRVCYRERANVFTKRPVSQDSIGISGWIIVLADFVKSWCFILFKELRYILGFSWTRQAPKSLMGTS